MSLDRRQFMKLGGITALSAAIAACTKDKPKAGGASAAGGPAAAD